MMLLLDQGLPRSAVQHLAAGGIASQHVGDLGMAQATDAAILAYAVQHDHVVATLDADFHTLLALSGASRPSTIRIRIEGLDGQQLAAILADVLHVAGPDLIAGAMVTVTPPNTVRIRSLPVQ